jgi:hypothetical protein
VSVLDPADCVRSLPWRRRTPSGTRNPPIPVLTVVEKPTGAVIRKVDPTRMVTRRGLFAGVRDSLSTTHFYPLPAPSHNYENQEASHARAGDQDFTDSRRAVVPQKRSLRFGTFMRMRCRGRLGLVTGIWRLFLPDVGMQVVKQLFRGFQNSLWGRRKDYREVSQERRESHLSRLRQMARKNCRAFLL